MSCLESRPFHVGCVVNKVATGTGISLYISVSPLSIIPKMLHIPSSTYHWCYIILSTGIVLKWKPLRATCLVLIENIQQIMFNFLKLWQSECRVWDASDILVQKHFSEPKDFNTSHSGDKYVTECGDWPTLRHYSEWILEQTSTKKSHRSNPSYPSAKLLGPP